MSLSRAQTELGNPLRTGKRGSPTRPVDPQALPWIFGFTLRLQYLPRPKASLLPTPSPKPQLSLERPCNPPLSCRTLFSVDPQRISPGQLEDQVLPFFRVLLLCCWERGPAHTQVMAPPTHPLEGHSSRELSCSSVPKLSLSFSSLFSILFPCNYSSWTNSGLVS